MKQRVNLLHLLALATLIVLQGTATRAQTSESPLLLTGDASELQKLIETTGKQLAKMGGPGARTDAEAAPLATLLWAHTAAGNLREADSISQQINGWIGSWDAPQQAFEGEGNAMFPLRKAQFMHLLHMGYLLQADSVMGYAINHLRRSGNDTLRLAEAYTLKAWAMYHAGRFGDAAYPLKKAEELFESVFPGLSVAGTKLTKTTRQGYELLADFRLAQMATAVGHGDHELADTALQAFLNPKGPWVGLLGNGHYLLVKAQTLYALNADLWERPTLAEDRYRLAIKTSKKLYGRHHPETLRLTTLYANWQARHDRSAEYAKAAHHKTLASLNKELAWHEKQQKKAKRTTLNHAMAPFLVELALFYEEIDNLESAKRTAQQVLSSVESTGLGKPTWSRARAYGLFADADIEDRRYKNARLYANAFRDFVEKYHGTRGNEYAYALIQLGRIELTAFELDKARAHTEAALEVDRLNLTPTHTYYMKDLRTYADVLLGASAFEEAEGTLVEVLAGEMALFGQQSYPWVDAQAARGRVALRLGSFDKADKLLAEALSMAESLPGASAPIQASILELLAQVYQAKGQFQQSQEFYLRAMRLRRRRISADPSLQATSVVGLASLYRDQGRYSDAIKVLQEAINLMELSNRTDKNYLEALATLASIYAETGKFQEAEAYALKNRNLVLQSAGTGSLEYAQSLVLLSGIVTDMGRYGEAQVYLEQAQQGYEKYYGESNINSAQLYADLGLNHFLQGNPDQALALLTKALGVAESAVGTQHLSYADMQRRLAQLYLSLREFEKAEQLLTSVKSIQATTLGTKHPDYWRTIGQFAELYKVTGRYRESQNQYQDLLANWKRLLGENHPEYAFYLSDFADLLYRKGDDRGARKTYFEANELLLLQVNRYFPALSEQEKAEFWTRISAKLERYYTYVLANGFADPKIREEAYNLRLRTKALLLTASTAIRNQILASNDEELTSLFQAWQTRREYLAKLYTLSQEEVKTLGVNVEEIENEVNSLEKELSLKSDVFARGVEETPPTWDLVRKKLGPNEAAVEIIRVRAGAVNPSDSIAYLALVLKPDYKAPDLVIIPDGNLLERRYLLNYSRSVANKFKDELSYGKFWEPLEPSLAGSQVIYFSADGVYNKISLPSLLLPDGSYLIDRRSIYMVANTKDLLEQRIRKYFEGRTALLMGDPTFNTGTVTQNTFVVPPLEGTGEEIRQVNNTLAESGWETEVLTKADANEEHLKSAASPKLVHLSTHGFFYPKVEGETGGSLLGVQAGKAAQNPLLRSGLFLAGAGETLSEEEAASSGGTSLTDNGIITAYEVMNMNLGQTELVILSACETGLGEVQNGEGVYGLQRAFTVAGAKAVIMSLWRVNDQVTQQMISQFYDNWVGRGLELHAAFRAAQQQVRARYPEAYYWGAFVMMGS